MHAKWKRIKTKIKKNGIIVNILCFLLFLAEIAMIYLCYTCIRDGNILDAITAGFGAISWAIIRIIKYREFKRRSIIEKLGSNIR